MPPASPSNNNKLKARAPKNVTAPPAPPKACGVKNHPWEVEVFAWFVTLYVY
jgi:hypothetical protein